MTATNIPFDHSWIDYLSRHGRLCVFVGAGISAGCTTDDGNSPLNWDDLISSLAGEFDCAVQVLNEKLGSLERAELIERARIKAGISTTEFNRAVASRVDVIDGKTVRESSFHQTLVDLNPELIITTNYDGVIERCLNGSKSQEVGYNVWTYPGRIEQLAANSSCKADSSLGDLLRSGEPLIVKIHGGVGPLISEGSDIAAETGGAELIDNMHDDGELELVFSFTSYQRAYGPDATVPAFLKAVFASHQVVFAGYSLRDQVLRDILMSNGTLKGKHFQHVILQSRDSVVPEVYAEAFSESYGVKVVNYDRHNLASAALHQLKFIRN